MKTSILCIFILATISAQASALMCYICTAPLSGSGDCFRNKLTSAQLRNCSNGEEFCKTEIEATEMFGADGVTSMSRSCSSSNDNVSNVGNTVEFAVSCNTDGCNTQGPMFIDPPTTGTPATAASQTTTECDNNGDNSGGNGGNTGTGGGAAETKSTMTVVLSVAMILICKFL